MSNTITDTATAQEAGVFPQYLRVHIGQRPARANVQLSKHGNAFYAFSAQGLELDEGMESTIAVELDGDTVVIPHDVPKDPAKRVSKAGNAKREGRVDVVVAGTPYIASVVLSDAKTGIFCKVAVTKKPQPGERKPQIRGGAFED